MRSNRQMPALIKNANPNPGQQMCARQGRVILVAHKDAGRRKPVRVLSTVINARSENGRPAAVQHHNNINWRDVQTKNVVNNADISSLKAPWQNGRYKN